MTESSTQLPPESSWTPQLVKGEVPVKKKFILNAQNPDQLPEYNLAASSATRTVGSMASHWTCCTPRQYPEAFKDGPDKGRRERSDLFTNDEWEVFYKEGEDLFITNDINFDNSVRHCLVKKLLCDALNPGGVVNREIKSMPLACKPGKARTISSGLVPQPS